MTVMEPSPLEDEIEEELNSASPSQQTKFKREQNEALEIQIPDNVKILMKEAFAIKQVLTGIFNHLTFADLLECRLVCRRWGHYAGNLLTSQNSAQVNLEFYWQEDDPNPKKSCVPFHRPDQKWRICFIGKKGLVRTVNQYMGQRVKSEYPYDMEIFCLPALTSLLKHSKNFPCSTFSLWDADLGHEELQQFFEVQGSKIQTLKLNSANPDSPFEKVALQFKQKSLELPELKYISWAGWDKRSVLRIMKAAPNLKVCALMDDAVERLDEVLSVKKVAAVKRLKIIVSNVNLNYSKNIKNFAKGGPLLQTLEFDTKTKASTLQLASQEVKLKSKLIAASSALLEATKATLENLSLGQLCAKFELKSLPIFANLRKLSLTLVEGLNESAGEGCALLPPKLNLKDYFPKLESLELKTNNFNEYEDPPRGFKWESHFPAKDLFTNGFQTVKILEIEAGLCCDDQWLEKIGGSLCPNFKILVLLNCNKFKLDKCLRKIFNTWKHLHVLKLHFEIGEEMPSLDEQFIGFSKDNFRECHGGQMEILERLKSPQDSYNVDGSLPSVCDLKELKTIEIWTTGRAFFADDVPLRRDSLLYISKVMPNLQVRVHIRKNSISMDDDHFLLG